MALNTVDPRQYLNDAEEAQRLAQEGLQSRMWVAMPAIVQKVSLTKMTLEAIPAIQGRFVDPNGKLHFIDMPPCLDVPICYPSGGGFTITYPIEFGDEVLIVFANRCIDAWWQSGGYSNKPMEFRMNDLSDGFAIPGPKSQPNVITAISALDMQIRNDAGDTYLSIGADGLIGFKNAVTDLKTVLVNFESAVNTFMTALAAFSGGAAPVTQAMLQAPASTAVTALTTVLTEIGALLK